LKIYTRTGDDGTTGLFGGQRVDKTHARVEAYGVVDEANSFIGLAASASDLPTELHEPLLEIMSDLFDVGAELATPPDPTSAQRLAKHLDNRVDAARITALEGLIDTATAQTAPLKTFVLPTGTDASARLHVARTVVRRAERAVLGLRAHDVVRDEVVHYLNRLSDLLFAWARFANAKANVGDVPWRAKKNP
jgi:cob(I)alamin adenosyltransferase